MHVIFGVSKTDVSEFEKLNGRGKENGERRKGDEGDNFCLGRAVDVLLTLPEV